jgi:hypothetical protein
MCAAGLAALAIATGQPRKPAVTRHTSYLMKLKAALVLFAGLIAHAAAQEIPQSSQPPGAPAPATSPTAVQPVLQQLQETAQVTTSDLSHLRIDKWKADGSTKQQAQQMAASVSRNLNAALPDLVQASRTQPMSLAAQFKLYHNLTALYETLASLTETAGAFGGKQEFDALSSDANRLDTQRRSLADYVQGLAAQNDAELARYRTQAAHAATQAAAAPPKKIIVDNDVAPAKTSTPAKRKSSTQKPATSTPQQPPE